MLHENLQQLAAEVAENPLTIGEGLRRLGAGSRDYGVSLLLLALPAALPVPTFGLKPLVGLVVILLGLQMLIGKRSAWLPRWFISIRLRPEWSLRAACLGERFFSKLEGFVRPRNNWMKHRIGLSFLGLAIMCLGLVFILSIIPGAKILAGLVLLTLSIGLIERDGLLTLLAALAAFALVALHAEFVYLLRSWLVG